VVEEESKAAPAAPKAVSAPAPAKKKQPSDRKPRAKKAAATPKKGTTA
jgi:hypothetical protein